MKAGAPDSEALRRQLRDGLARLPGTAPGASCLDALCAYATMLQDWSRAYNLISPRALSEFVPRHLLDSLRLAPHLPGAGAVLDLGTGAGLPGVPLALVHPERPFVLLDRSRKKTRFVRQVALELGLANVAVRTADARDFRHPPVAAITARAVGPTAQIIADAAHLLDAAGTLLLLKGARAAAELRRLPTGWRATTHVQGAQAGCIVAVRRAGAAP